jgi:predicted acylesterase/phospholipase RssA
LRICSRFIPASLRRPVAAALIGACAAAGCTTEAARFPVPEADVSTATATIAPTASIGAIRVWGDEAPVWFDQLVSRPAAELKSRMPEIYGKPHTYLALSGGGENGAYGAGILNGWTAAGNRPEFTFVTGISTGSLIAPFAFLGPKYDYVLTEIYTKYSTKDLVRKKAILSMLTSDSAADTAPLRALIARYVDANVIAAIAGEHRKGRRLFIGTTNLDAGRPVIWNIGEIAISGDPKAPALIHDILLASASIPGAFPPVRINVNVNGQSFDEMHVDGGTTSQVFFYPAGIDWKKALKALKVPGKPAVYVVRNASLQADYSPTRQRILPIASRSISALIRTQGIGDLYRIYSNTQRDGVAFHVTYIPNEFDMKSKEAFDTTYMRALYDVGYELGKSGKAWHDKPPG